MMPGGVVVNPPELVRASVRKHLPQLPIEHFDRIGSIYNTMRHYRPEPPAKVRDALQKIAEKAADLYIDLGKLSEEAADALWHAAYARGRPAIQQEVELGLQMLMGIGRDGALAQGAPSAGAPTGARRAMVLSLANLLEAHGLAVDAKPKGNLVFLTSSILEAYDEQVADVRKLVADALETIAST
jgi:hypothetical protein